MTWVHWAMFGSGLFAGWGLGVMTVCLLAKSAPDVDQRWVDLKERER